MSNMIRWNPFREMMSLRNEIDRLFDQSLNVDWPLDERGLQELALDLSETDDAYVVKASVPGIAADELDISLTDNVLAIKGEFKREETTENKRYHLRERRYGTFERSVRFPMQVQADQVEAAYDAGVLTLTVPKAEEVRPRRIAIKVGGNGQKVIEGNTAS